MDQGFIYMIKNKVNNKVYIGQAEDIKTRWRWHKSMLNSNAHTNKHLQNSWNKYGKDNFEFTIIEQPFLALLTEKEDFWIKHYNSLNPKFGFNLREAGDSGTFNDEIKLKISKGKLGQTHSEETKKKISMSIKQYYLTSGNKNPRLGVTLSNETKEKISKAQLGKKLSNETKSKISRTIKKKLELGLLKTNKGQKLSDETKCKISQSHIGKTHSEETKEKIGSKNRRLTDEQVLDILERLKQGEKPHLIGLSYGVSRHTICKIRDGLRYKHLTT